MTLSNPQVAAATSAALGCADAAALHPGHHVAVDPRIADRADQRRPGADGDVDVPMRVGRRDHDLQPGTDADADRLIPRLRARIWPATGRLRIVVTDRPRSVDTARTRAIRCSTVAMRCEGTAMRVAPRTTNSARTNRWHPVAPACRRADRSAVAVPLDAAWSPRPAPARRPSCVSSPARAAPVAWCPADLLGDLARRLPRPDRPGGRRGHRCAARRLVAGDPRRRGSTPGPASESRLIIDDLHVIASTLAESELGRLDRPAAGEAGDRRRHTQSSRVRHQPIAARRRVARDHRRRSAVPNVGSRPAVPRSLRHDPRPRRRGDVDHPHRGLGGRVCSSTTWRPAISRSMPGDA